jgi:purine-binding chemotaxis protein CheW
LTQGYQRFLFSIEGRRYALGIDVVERVVRAVAVTPLSDGPEVVLGVINLHGRVVPVLDLRRRLGHPGREIRSDDHLVIAHTKFRTIAFFADSAEGVSEDAEGSVTPGAEVVPGLEFVQGVMRLGEDLVLIHDLDRVLSLEEHGRLSAALGETAADD